MRLTASGVKMKMARFLASQAAAMVFMPTALILTVIHPAIHQYELGTLDTILDYVYATSLDAMNRNG
jgi:hypothetical protein